VLRLTPQRAPVDFVRRFLPNVAPRAESLQPLSRIPFFAERRIKAADYLLGAVDGEHLAALVDQNSGDAEVFPSLSRVRPLSREDIRRAAAIASERFTQTDVIGKDDTRAVVDKALVLNGEKATLSRGARLPSFSDRAAYLVYVPLRRFVERYPVYGRGSRALLVIGSGGSLQGFVRQWKTAATFDRVTETRTRDEVARAILAQLEPSARTSEVEVRSVEVAYYDGNRDFLQPVYRFTAKVSHLRPASGGDYRRRTDDDFVIGFVPIGKEMEAVPSLLREPGPQPQTPDANYKGAAAASPADDWLRPRASFAHPFRPESPAAGPPGTSLPFDVPDPTVGRYVVRDDDSNWVADANEFWQGLTFSFPFFTTGAAFFTNSQYFWAEPRLFTTQKNSFANSVNIALIEVHGDWWLYSTERNCCDLVDIQNIPSPGYGTSAGGHMSYWVIHSCEVVPGPDDTSGWSGPWWNIFGGVHSVVGYRTIMYIDDDVGFPYGFKLTFFAPAVSGWLNAVSSASAYSGRPMATAHGGINRPMGRASTISTCGREDDTVFDTSALPRAGCLRVFWYPD
jgi:hypothetical protein